MDARKPLKARAESACFRLSWWGGVTRTFFCQAFDVARLIAGNALLRFRIRLAYDQIRRQRRIQASLTRQLAVLHALANLQRRR